MRVILVSIFLLSLCDSTAQSLESEKSTSQELYDFHIKKKRTNNTMGWITLSSGLAMVLTGLVINEGNKGANALAEGASFGLVKVNNNSNKGLWLTYLGGGITLSSIYFFSSSGKHKKKAQIQLQQGAIGFNNKYKFSGLKITYSF